MPGGKFNESLKSKPNVTAPCNQEDKIAIQP